MKLASQAESVQKKDDFYARKKDADLVLKEFGYYSLDRWKREGYISDNTDLNRLFGFDQEAWHNLGQLGGCEAAFCPCFEEKVLEDRGEYELAQDFAGRKVLYFKGRRNGFMPQYVDHPVKDIKTLEALRWRLDPSSPERYRDLEKRMDRAKKRKAEGAHIQQLLVGGYMYLRALIGPEDLLFKFYDDPDLIHACMRLWFELADRVIARHQEHIDIDELFFSEDICYNKGPLISPEMMRGFLLPYYRQLIQNMRSRQRDKSKKLWIQVDTDGDCRPVIPLYQEIGMEYISPCEVAAGCDVVEIRKKYPDLLLRGGIDKRILAKGRDAIARELERVIPFMKERGGYIPMCDHGVPEEVSFEDYMYFREALASYNS